MTLNLAPLSLNYLEKQLAFFLQKQSNIYLLKDKKCEITIDNKIFVCTVEKLIKIFYSLLYCKWSNPLFYSLPLKDCRSLNKAIDDLPTKLAVASQRIKTDKHGLIALKPLPTTYKFVSINSSSCPLPQNSVINGLNQPLLPQKSDKDSQILPKILEFEESQLDSDESAQSREGMAHKIQTLGDISDFKATEENVRCLESIKTTKKATQYILTIPGFVAEKNDLGNSFGLEKGEVQGNSWLRYAAAYLTKKFPQSIDIESLRQEKLAGINYDQYLTILFKYFSHTFALKGEIPLPNKQFCSLEGFSEVFTLPLLANSFGKFCGQHQVDISEEDAKWVIEQANNMTSSEATDFKMIQKITLMLQDLYFFGPICLGSGHSWHSTATIFFRNYLIYCNRGEGEPEPGIYVYQIFDRSVLTEQVVWAMIKRQEIIKSESFGTERIKEDLKASLVHYEPMSGQLVGNCTFASMEALLFSLIVIRRVMKERKSDISTPLWRENFQFVKTKYFEKWSAFNQFYVFKQLTEDIQQWMASKDPFLNQLDLYPSYCKLLSTWYKRYKYQQEAPGISFSEIKRHVQSWLLEPEIFLFPPGTRADRKQKGSLRNNRLYQYYIDFLLRWHKEHSNQSTIYKPLLSLEQIFKCFLLDRRLQGKAFIEFAKDLNNLPESKFKEVLKFLNIWAYFNLHS